MIIKLYRVTLKGMNYVNSNGVVHGIAYVVADSLDHAYDKVKKSLDEDDIGFTKERALDKVELIAEEGHYPTCGYTLYL